MAMSGGSDDGAPMMEMNMTPLIDVLLVLLIMFIITIPVATHAVNIDLPTPNPNSNPNDVKPDKNKIIITTEGVIKWNGDEISENELISRLTIARDMRPEPELQFEPMANASYEVSAKVLNWIKGTEVTKFGFVGNEKYRDFGKAAEAE